MTDIRVTCDWCHAEDACATCGVRRDEHADQSAQSAIPALDITDHVFTERDDYPNDHYADYHPPILEAQS